MPLVFSVYTAIAKTALSNCDNQAKKSALAKKQERINILLEIIYIFPRKRALFPLRFLR